MMNRQNTTPGSMLEIYMHALANGTADEFLDEINLGIGNYSSGEYWQQIESFRRGMYADAAMTRTIIARAKRQTIKAMVDAIYDDASSRILSHVKYPQPGSDQEKEDYMETHMEDVWQSLGIDGKYTPAEHQAWLIHTCTGMKMNWTPPHWRMLKARHEASRSKNGRLIDNLFGRPPEPDLRPQGEEFH